MSAFASPASGRRATRPRRGRARRASRTRTARAGAMSVGSAARLQQPARSVPMSWRSARAEAACTGRPAGRRSDAACVLRVGRHRCAGLVHEPRLDERAARVVDVLERDEPEVVSAVVVDREREVQAAAGVVLLHRYGRDGLDWSAVWMSSLSPPRRFFRSRQEDGGGQARYRSGAKISTPPYCRGAKACSVRDQEAGHGGCSGGRVTRRASAVGALACAGAAAPLSPWRSVSTSSSHRWRKVVLDCCRRRRHQEVRDAA
jgi:hypothetical protein